MADAEQTRKRTPQRSLLSLAPSVRPSAEHVDAGDKPDAAALHRMARSRREAAPSPLLAALARDKGPTTPAGEADEVSRSPIAAEPNPSLADRIAGYFDRAEPEATPDRPEVAAYSPVIRRPVEAEEPESNARAGRSSDDQVWRPLIDPMAVIGGVINSKGLILATTVAGMAIGVMIAISTPKKYESAAELLIDPRDLQLTDRTLTQTGLPSDATLAIVENQVRIITSGSVLNRVVQELKLDQDPEFNGDREGFSIGQFIGQLRSLLSPGGGGEGGDRRHALAVEGLAQALTVERGGKTFVVVVAAKTEDPEKSARIANTVTQAFLQVSGRIQADTATRATDELSARLDELKAAVETAERKVETYKQENDLIDAQGKLIGDDELIKINEQLSIARARTLELNARAASTRAASVDAALGGVLPEELNSNVMVELRSQYASLKRESDRLSVSLGPRHPQRQAMETELAGLRSEIGSELRRVISSVQTELKRAVQLEQDLAARLAQVKVRQSGASEDLVELRELERDAASKRSVYEAFLLRARETGEQKDINTANMSVISEAYPPLEPTGPSRAVIAITGLIMGFFAGIGLGALRGAASSLRSSMRSRRGSRSSSIRAARATDTATPAVAIEAAAPVKAEASEVKTAAVDAADTRADPAPRTKPLFGLFDRVLRSRRSEQNTMPVTDEPPSAGPDTPEPAMYPYPYPYQPQQAQPVHPHQPQLGQYQGQPHPGQPVAYPHPAAWPAQPAQYPHPVQAAPQSYPAAPVPPAPIYAQSAYLPPAYSPPPYAPPAYTPSAAYPSVYPPSYAAQPASYSYPPQPLQAAPWYPQPAPQPATYQPAPYQAAPAYQPAAPEPVHHPQDAVLARSDVEEVRESLREFRAAVRDLQDSRGRRRA